MGQRWHRPNPQRKNVSQLTRKKNGEGDEDGTDNTKGYKLNRKYFQQVMDWVATSHLSS